MKKINYSLVATLLLLCTFFISCSKGDSIGDDGDDNGGDNITLSEEMTSAKWLLSEDNIYTSFEFNESGNYIITGKATKAASGENKVLYCGAYRIIDGITIELIDFGTITILDLTSAGKLKAKITRNGEIEITVNATKESQFPESARLDLLCRTWTDNYGNYLIMSKSGTFCQIDTDLIEEVGYDGIMYGKWKWKTGETVFSYKYDGYGADWEISGEVTILELTSTYMRASEIHQYTEDGKTETETFTLYPATNVKFPKPDKGTIIHIDTIPPIDTIPTPKPLPQDSIDIADILGTWECTANYEYVKENGVIDPSTVRRDNEVGYIWTFNEDGTFDQYKHYQGDWHMNENKIVIKNDGGSPFEFDILALTEESFVIECNAEITHLGNQYVVYNKITFKRLIED